MKIVSIGDGGWQGDSLALFVNANEVGQLVALLRRARDTVKHTRDWEFSSDLQEHDAVRLDVIADSVEDVSFGHQREEEVNL